MSVLLGRENTLQYLKLYISLNIFFKYLLETWKEGFTPAKVD